MPLPSRNPKGAWGLDDDRCVARRRRCAWTSPPPRALRSPCKPHARDPFEFSDRLLAQACPYWLLNSTGSMDWSRADSTQAEGPTETARSAKIAIHLYKKRISYQQYLHMYEDGRNLHESSSPCNSSICPIQACWRGMCRSKTGVFQYTFRFQIGGFNKFAFRLLLYRKEKSNGKIRNDIRF